MDETQSIATDKDCLSLALANNAKLSKLSEILATVLRKTNHADEDLAEENILAVSRHYQAVKDFMKGANQSTPSNYIIPTKAERILRARLVLEETLEFIIKGLGVGVDTKCGILHAGSAKAANYQVVEDFDPIETIDGVCDIHVTSTGALVAMGIPDTLFIQAVDDNNLEKIANGHTNPETGKFEKHPDHRPPDIEALFTKVLEIQDARNAFEAGEIGG